MRDSKSRFCIDFPIRVFAVCPSWFAKEVRACGSLQRRLPMDDVLLRSGDTDDNVAKLSEIASNLFVLFFCFGTSFLGMEGSPNF